MTEKKQLLSAAFLLPAAAFLSVCLIRQPDECSICVGETLRALYKFIIPVLFPFMTISGILTGLNLTGLIKKTVGNIFSRIYRLPASAAAAFFLGALCSYPIGAVTIADLYGKGELTKEEAERGAALVSVTGPAFPVATVGTLLLGNARTGWLIYIVQIIVPLILGVPFCRKLSKSKTVSVPNKVKMDRKGILSIVTEAISSSSIRCVSVCGTIVFFSLFCDRLIAVTGASGTSAALICSVLEFSEGCRRAALLPGAAAAAVCSFSVSCGGLSVIAQSAAVMEKEGLPAVKLAVFKLICGSVSGITVFLAASLLELFEPKAATVRAFSIFEVPSAIQVVMTIVLSAGVMLRIRYLILKSH